MTDRLEHADYGLVLHKVWTDSPWFDLRAIDDIFPGDGDEILIPPDATLHTDQENLSQTNLDRIDTEEQREPITLVRHPTTGELWIYDGHHRWVRNRIQGRPTLGRVWTPRMKNSRHAAVNLASLALAVKPIHAGISAGAMRSLHAWTDDDTDTGFLWPTFYLDEMADHYIDLQQALMKAGVPEQVTLYRLDEPEGPVTNASLREDWGTGPGDWGVIGQDRYQISAPRSAIVGVGVIPEGEVFIDLSSASITKAAAIDSNYLREWEMGDRAWFEYHCLESDESCDVEVWRHSHEQVEVIGIPVDQEPLAQSAELTPQERLAEGIPRLYTVRWEDGFEHDVFEDELGLTTDFFHRPPPPSKREAAEIHTREDDTFLREPHERLYPALFDENENMRPEARDAIIDYFEEHVGQYFPDVPKQFNIIGSGISYNWDEAGDLDVQVWVPEESKTAMRDQLTGHNFPTIRDLGLDGDMEVQYYVKGGEGTPEENLAEKPYALYDLTADEWLAKPFPMTPEFYADNFLAVWSRANEIAESVTLALATFKRLAAEWAYWNALDLPKYEEHRKDLFEKLLKAQERVGSLYADVVVGRQQAYTREGEGIHDPRDAIVKMLEIWGIFEDLKDWARSDMPWEKASA